MNINVRAYMVLLAVLQPDRRQKLIPEHLEKLCTEAPKVLWIDKGGVALGCVSDKSAWHLYNHLVKGPTEGINRILVVELGNSWCTASQTQSNGWFNSHLGPMTNR